VSTDPPRQDPPPIAVAPPAQGGAPGEDPAPPPKAAYLPVGEALQVGPAAPLSRPPTHRLAEGLSAGSQALAQLSNLNFFVGRVKAIDSDYITLGLDRGEVTLAFDKLASLVPLASDEARELQQGTAGFVKLRNNNKLFGQVIKRGLSDNVILEIQKNQVVIPSSAVEEIGDQRVGDVRVREEQGDREWIQQMLRAENEGSRARPKDTEQPPPPAPPKGQ
jgi:hypothetical protein